MSRDLISWVTGQLAEELTAWQSRPPDRIDLHPAVLIDAIFVKIREGQAGNPPVSVAVNWISPA